ncbi:MAG: phospho-sugar mutase [Terrimicrobiaceae bacterium]|nr:phospho-sugar mutase [Terrimicrobiaceae bacterium]
MSNLLERIRPAADSGLLLPASAKNLAAFLVHNRSSVSLAAIDELIAAENWTELDNRFFRTLAFGTGGLRGKSIGAVVTAAERGAGGPNGRPEHPCVGTNAMNYYNLSRATQGLAAYVLEWHATSGRTQRPAICIAHDTRHFSREFAEFVAKVIADLGVDALLFEGPRSTPELSFAVRQTGAAAGINLTASHNPPEYNGYKVYFADGGQIVEPHASRIIARVNAIAGESYEPVAERGRIVALGANIDAPYLDALESLLLDPAVVRNARLRIVFSALHGVGGEASVPILRRVGCEVSTVAAQDVPDGRFPTVKSPNPENAEALNLAMRQADAGGTDLVLATDPDADRLGVAARSTDGALHLLTGNQLGSLMAWYRAMKFFELGRLTRETASSGVIIKTFVTTDLQKAIAEKFGLRCVETLTGFKYIGAKLAKYEADGGSIFVFGGEESYGYSGADFVRDKDANAAAVMIAEVAAFAKSRGQTLPELLDALFAEFGVHLEHSESLVMEGADGAAKIQALSQSYRDHPPATIAGAALIRTRDFAAGGLVDVEGDAIPPESMTIFDVEGGLRVAVRPSGTEPKIKFYLFVAEPPSADVAAAKARARDRLDAAWAWLDADAKTRGSNVP